MYEEKTVLKGYHLSIISGVQACQQDMINSNRHSENTDSYT